LPDATPKSIAPPSPAHRGKRVLIIQIVVTTIVLLFVARALFTQWRQFRGTPLIVSPNWTIIITSGLVVIATYALLVETWRRILGAWGSALAFPDAVRIWCVSNLGRYVPGKVWQIGAMSTMAERAGVSAAAAAGSAVLNTIVNIATGFLVALVAGWRSFDTLSNGNTGIGIAILTIALGGVLLLPTALPYLLAVARRVTGRALDLGPIPHRAIVISLIGNIVAWLMYGAAFELFVRGVIGSAPGAFADYVTAYAWPYILGYLAILLPGGLGVRDSALAVVLGALKLATPPQAVVVTVTSRLWLTVLELVPGFIYLARGMR
jgi:glycosyltransferase 2 family protein